MEIQVKLTARPSPASSACAGAALPLLALLLAVAPPANGDTLRLTDGSALSGIVVEVNPERVRFVGAAGQEQILARADVAAIAFGSASLPEASGSAPEVAPAPTAVPGGAHLAVSLIDDLNSDVNGAGETFRGALAAPVLVEDQEVLSKDAAVWFEVARIDQAGALTGKEEVTLELQSIQVGEEKLAADSEPARIAKRAKGGIFAATGTAATLAAAATGHKTIATYAAIGTAAVTAMEVLRGTKIKLRAESVLIFTLKSELALPQPAEPEGAKE